MDDDDLDDLDCTCGHPFDEHDVNYGSSGAVCLAKGCTCKRYDSSGTNDDDSEE